MMTKKQKEVEEEIFDFSYYKIERSKTLDRSYEDKQMANHKSVDPSHQKRFANIYTWLESTENLAEDVHGRCPCCFSMEDNHYACSDVTHPSKLITFSPHRRNFDADVRYARTASFSNPNISHSRSGSSPMQNSYTEYPGAAVSKQRTFSLSTQYRYQAMNQQQRSSSKQENSYYSTANCKSEYATSTPNVNSGSKGPVRGSGIHNDQPTTFRPRSGSYLEQPTAPRPRYHRQSTSTSSFHSRTGSEDSCKTEYFYFDFQNEGSQSGSGWEVTRKAPVLESPLRKHYV